METQASNGKIRTLVVEDKWLLRRATRMVLTHEPDIEVVGTAKDGVAALDRIEALRPDVVVADIAMPSMGGLELSFLLRRRFPAIRIVLVTPTQAAEISDLCGLCGADLLMNKARIPDKLPALIRMMFKSPRLSPDRQFSVP